jgi:DNA replicative helicase MCM subunit Mcm2 (Cdc46/Mcm family)
VAVVDRSARDRWLVRAADRTAARLESVLARLRGQGDDPLADEAIAVYAVTPAFVEELRAMAEKALALVPAGAEVRASDVDIRNELLARIEAAGREGVTTDDLIALGAERGVSKVEVEEALAGLLDEGECYMPRRGQIRIA